MIPAGKIIGKMKNKNKNKNKNCRYYLMPEEWGIPKISACPH
jgi:hypothetical protein